MTTKQIVPEDQAGLNARECPKCQRMTVHQTEGICLVETCDYLDPK